MAEKKPTKPATKTKTVRKPRVPKHIGLVANDMYLEPYEEAIKGRHDHALWKINQLTRNGKSTLRDFASGYDYFGLHKTARGWVFREWAPTATDIYLVGDFNDWQETEKYRAKRVQGTGNWELKLPSKAMKHGDLYKMHVHWNGGEGERIPAWATRVVQDDDTKIFSAQVWNPEPYTWKKKTFKPNVNPLLIYECHIGMAQDAEKVGTYTEFKDNVLPRIIADGYNCIQIMAIQEHPYYGSFGYHVSSFFAASSRFGTPEELKALIDTAHQNGVAVIMDIVHSHAVKMRSRDLAILPVTPTSTSIPATSTSIRHGTRSASIMARMRSSISCSPTANTGSRSSISTASASMASPPCSTTATDWVRPSATTATISTVMRTTTPSAT